MCTSLTTLRTRRTQCASLRSERRSVERPHAPAPGMHRAPHLDMTCQREGTHANVEVVVNHQLVRASAIDATV